jgi:hypothetical protein
MLYHISTPAGPVPVSTAPPAATAAVQPCTMDDLMTALVAQLDMEQCRTLAAKTYARLHEIEDGY